MAFSTWREAATHLERVLEEPSEVQVRLASAAGVPLRAKTPQLVAAARLRSALRSELRLSPHGASEARLRQLYSVSEVRLPREDGVSEGQADYLAGLAKSLKMTVPIYET